MKMEKPKLALVRFDSADVIATSGGGVVSGLCDGTPNNASLTVGGASFNLVRQAEDVAAALGHPGTPSQQIFFVYGEDDSNFLYLSQILAYIEDKDEDPDHAKAAYNGTYKYLMGSEGYYWYKKQP